VTVDERAPQTRRRLLTAAATGVAALAAEKLARPMSAAATVVPMNVDVDNPSTALTSITQGTADTDAFKATANGTGTGISGVSTTGVAVLGQNGSATEPAIVGLQGDLTGSEWLGSTDLQAGVYGFCDRSGAGVGVEGESQAGIGVGAFAITLPGTGLLAIGGLGAFIEGYDGAYIVSDSNQTGLHVRTGTGSSAPTPPANTALYASVGSNTQVGIEAHGRIRFPNRSGRATILSGHSSVTVSVSGMTSSNFAMAVLNSNRTGRWVRAVVCATGSITIYLNTAVTSTTYVSWLVLG
jgi:hypothetical protein